MSTIWTRQPGTALFSLYFALYTLVRIPLLLILYLLPSLRPNRHWTYRQSIARTLFVYFGEYVSTVEIKVPPSLKPGREKDRFVIIQPAQKHVYRDILLCDSNISPVTIGAVWTPEPISHSHQHKRGRRVFFHLHGGAYVLGGGRDFDMGFANSLLLRYSPGSAIFCPEYRLASMAGGRFPGPLQDAVTAYAYLVTTLQIPASDIILSGDSAGAHLALALLRYINAHPDILPEPAAMLLWSPWPDMTIEVAAAYDSPALKVDHVAPELISWTYRTFLPSKETKIPRSDPHLSPSMAAIPTRIPIWVQWGSAEILNKDIEKFVLVQRSGSDAAGSGKFGTCEVLHAPHDILVLAPLLGWKAEAAKAVEQAMLFLQQAGLDNQLY